MTDSSTPRIREDLLRGALTELRRPTHDDIAAFAGYSHDVHYSRMLRRSRHYPASLEGMRQWFAEMDKHEEEIPFSIYTRSEPRLVGWIVLKDIYWASRHCSFFIGIGPAAERGRGYGPDAVRVALRYAFDEMNLNAVRLDVMAYNTAAQRAYAKVGFREDGRLRAFVYRDGIYHDVICMSLLRSEWQDIPEA